MAVWVAAVGADERGRGEDKGVGIHVECVGVTWYSCIANECVAVEGGGGLQHKKRQAWPGWCKAK